MTNSKYAQFGLFLKKIRQEKYRSAREFSARNDLGISYPQYSRYEAGEQLPSLDQAVKIFELLGLPALQGTMEWCRAQVSDEKVGETLASLAQSAASGQALSPAPRRQIRDALGFGNTLVFNRAQLQLFASDPLFRDIFTYVNAYVRSGTGAEASPGLVSAEEMSRAFDVSVERIVRMAGDLIQLGVLTEVQGGYRPAEQAFFFPNDADFFELRNKNIRHNVDKIMSGMTYDQISTGQAYRGLITRELSEAQVQEVIAELDSIIARVGQMKQAESPDQVYSLALVLGERFRRGTKPQPEATQPEKGPRLSLAR